MPDLTPRQRRFVAEYLIDYNGAAAARRAGYSSRCAREVAYELLTYPHVSTAVVAESERLARELRLTRRDVVLKLVEAAEMALQAGDVRAAIHSWRHVALLLGFYTGARPRVSNA